MARILIVDDDTDLLDGQKVYLEKKGYTVQTALSIDEGLACARETAPNLVIADLMMEHYDSGFVFCKKLRDPFGGVVERTVAVARSSGSRGR